MIVGCGSWGLILTSIAIPSLPAVDGPVERQAEHLSAFDTRHMVDLVNDLHLEHPLHQFNQFVGDASQGVRNQRNSVWSQVTGASDETRLVLRRKIGRASDPLG